MKKIKASKLSFEKYDVVVFKNLSSIKGGKVGDDPNELTDINHAAGYSRQC
jgi:hypothetical protein